MVGVRQIVEIQRLREQGCTQAQVAEKLGLHRNTVSKYWETPIEEVQDQPGRGSIVDPYRPFLEHRLKEYPDLKASRLHREISTFDVPGDNGRELLPDEPFEGSKRTIRRVVADLRPDPPRVYKPFETLPGQQFLADWAGPWKLGPEGESRKIWLFALVLGYSRVLYGRFVDGMDMVRFLECHKRAFEYLGGVPQEGVYDNCKTVVSDRVGSQIQFNPDFLRFALHVGFHPDACWVGDAESKGKVERPIGYVESDFLYSQPLEETALEELNEQLFRWLDEVANERIHQTTQERPSDRLAEEKAALGPLPKREIRIFESMERRVQKDGLFSFENNKYSVPHTHARSTVRVQAYRDRLEVYASGEKIAEHPRCHERGQLVTDEGHWTDRPTGARKRKSTKQARFEAFGDEAPSFLKQMARQRTGRLSEQVDIILSLKEEHEDEAIHDALKRAASFGNYSASAVKRILETKSKDPSALPEDPKAPPSNTRYSGPSIEVQTRAPEQYGKAAEVKSQ